MSEITILGPGGVPISPAANLQPIGYGLFQANPNYIAAQQDPTRVQTCFIEFHGHPMRYGSHQEIGFASMQPLLMDYPDSLSETVYPEDGRRSRMTVRLSVLDKDHQFTAAVKDVMDTICEVKFGFLGLDESDYITLAIGPTGSFRYNSAEIAWSFDVGDALDLVRGNVFDLASGTLSADIGPQDARIPLRAGVQFWAPSGIGVIGSEIITFTGKSGRFLTGCGRGRFGTRAASHLAGTPVSEGVRLRAHPMDLALDRMLSDDKTGARVPAALVNVASFKAAKARLDPNLVFEFFVWMSQSAAGWIESEIFRRCGCYWAYDAAGRIGVQDARPPTTAETVAELTQFDERGRAAEEDIRPETVINTIRYRYHPDPLTGAMQRQSREYQDIPSVLKKGPKGRTREIAGIREGNPGVKLFMKMQSRRLLRQHAWGRPEIQARGFLRDHLITPGDLVWLEHPHLPDIFAGARGIAGSYWEILSRTFRPKDGHVEMRAAWTGITEPVKVISDLPIDYGDATDEQKAKYAWIGAGDLVGVG